MSPFRPCLVALALVLCPSFALAADDDDELWDWLYEEDEDTKPPPVVAPNPDGTLPPANGTTQRFASGKLVLPLHGIELNLPSLGATSSDYYVIGGYWRLDPDGETHAVSHIVDEYLAGKLRGGTSIQLGRFAEKTCAVMASEFEVESAWSGTLEVYGRTWDAKGGIQVRKNGTRVWSVFLCDELGEEKLLLRRYFNADSTAAATFTTQMLRDLTPGKLKTLTTLEAIVRGYEARVRGSSRGIKDPMVTRQDKSLPAVRTVSLSHVGLTVSVPDDGQLWTVEKTPKFDGQDIFFRAAPYQDPTDLTLLRIKDAKSCDDAFSRLAGKDRRWETPANVPSGWSSRLAYASGTAKGFYLCRYTTSGALIAAVAADGRPPELGTFHPLLAAIATAAGPEVAPRTPVSPGPGPGPGPGPRPGPSYSRDESFFVGGWFLEVPLSSRDTAALGLDEARFPSFNYAGPGFGLSMAFGEVGGWIGRFALWASPAWGSLLSEGDETTSPRFGAQHWEAAFEYGFNLELGEGTALGLTLGWTGLSGPITKNSSVTASLMFASVADDVDDPSFVLRLTPVQIFAANERMLMSPLAIEAMVLVGGLAVGAEFQQIAAPEAGDEDIPAEAWALILRVGFGLGTLK